jgi:hypothetical protein
MRVRVSNIGIPVIIIGLLITSTIAARSQKPSAANDTVIFAVEKYETGDILIEPVVIIKGRSFINPPSGHEGDKASDKFTADYFKSGMKYRMLSGGGEAGQVTVKERIEPGCTDLRASITTNTIADLGGEVQALAINSDSFGSKTSARRDQSDEEKSAIVKMAQRLFRQKGVAATLIKDMKASHLAALDINRDGLFELTGSFKIEKGESGYSLFIIAEPEGLGYRNAFNWYYKATSEAGHENEQLVDALDIDKDGTMEIIIQHLYYESYDFVIYKKQKGVWRNIYRGGGGGC